MKFDLSRIGRYRLLYGYIMCVIALVFAHKLFIPGIGIALIGSAIRVWSAGHIAKNEEVTTGGPYSFTRNPLYVGSFIFGIGMVVTIQEWWLLVAYVIGFTIFYAPTIACEQKFLRRKFGQEYEDYCKRVPIFFPYKYAKGEGKFSFSSVLHNSEHKHMTASMVFLIVLVLLAHFRG